MKTKIILTSIALFGMLIVSNAQESAANNQAFGRANRRLYVDNNNGFCCRFKNCRYRNNFAGRGLRQGPGNGMGFYRSGGGRGMGPCGVAINQGVEKAGAGRVPQSSIQDGVTINKNIGRWGTGRGMGPCFQNRATINLPRGRR